MIIFRYSWLVNFHFTRQDKLIYADQVRQRKGMMKPGMDLGVAESDDEYEFEIGGMKKGIHKMLSAKEKAIKNMKKVKKPPKLPTLTYLPKKRNMRK